MLALHFRLLVRPGEHGVVFRLVLVDTRSGEVGFFADASVLRGHDPIAPPSLLLQTSHSAPCMADSIMVYTVLRVFKLDILNL